jgi:phosphatidylinositol 4-kinase
MFSHLALRIRDDLFLPHFLLSFTDVLCHEKIPVLVGMVRALGRVPGTGPTFFSLLFPASQENSSTTNPTPWLPVHSAQRPFSRFRSIIPRSMSHNVLSAQSSSSPSETFSLSTFEMGMQPPSPTEVLPNPEPLEPPQDNSCYYFNTVASSFPVLGKEEPNAKVSIQFSISQLQALFNLAKKMLAKEVLGNIDMMAEALVQVLFDLHVYYIEIPLM